MPTRRARLIVAALLVAATAIGFAPILRNDFINFDDPLYVTKNRLVQRGLTLANVRWAFTTTAAVYWHPLTWLSHMLDWQLYGMAAGGHHLTSLVLHTASTVLLFLFLAQATGALGASAVVAACFGVHPLHVESVAWVAERKDVLSTFFLMVALCAYLGWARRGGVARLRRSRRPSPAGSWRSRCWSRSHSSSCSTTGRSGARAARRCASCSRRCRCSSSRSPTRRSAWCRDGASARSAP